MGKILITGAAGFIGSHLVDLLLEEGEPIKRLRLLIPKGVSTKNISRAIEKKVDVIFGDIRDKKVVKKAMEGVEVVYHLAARIDFDGKSYEEYEGVNVEGTQNLLDACRGKKIQKFVFFSSIAVFGLPAGIGNIVNWDESFPKKYTNYYGQSKFEAEKRVIKAHEEWGIPYAIIRPASVYGPREQGPTLALYRAIKQNRFFMIGNGDNKMHYVFVRDLVGGARQAQLSLVRNGDYILAGDQPVKLSDLIKHIAGSIGKTVPSWYIPTDVALILSYVLEWVGKIVGIKPPLFPSRVKTMTTTYYYNIAKARKEIDYDPKVSFKEGAESTGRWYLENNLL